MEAINNLASAASKAVWGDSNTKENENPNATGETAPTTTTINNETQGQEPLSGKQGDVSKGEPFDAGNIDPSTETTKSLGTTTEPSGTTTEPTGTTTESTGKTEELSGTTTEPTGTTTEPTGEAAVSKGPTTEHPSTTGDTHFKAAQADIRDPETSATTDPKVEKERKNVDDSGAGLDESENPAKVDGPGPRPVDEVAAERGGDAGKVEGVDSKPDAAEGAAEGEDPKGEDKGSGEKYVKTSGLQADGGDFDATKPGAGREADRLLEEKGIANPAVAAAAKKDEAAASGAGHEEEGKEKKSLKEKIKAKLHKN